MFVPIASRAQLANHQALYLFNFTRYIEWPADMQEGNFTIGVLGSNSEVATALKDISTKRKVGQAGVGPWPPATGHRPAIAKH